MPRRQLDLEDNDFLKCLPISADELDESGYGDDNNNDGDYEDVGEWFISTDVSLDDHVSFCEVRSARSYHGAMMTRALHKHTTAHGGCRACINLPRVRRRAAPTI